MRRYLSVRRHSHGFLLLAVFSLPSTSTYGQLSSASATLAPDHITLAVPAPKGDVDGFLHVTINGAELANVTLRASPLTLGDNYAFVRFPESGSDLIRLDDKKLQCEVGKDCVVHYQVYDAWGTGTYQGSIDAYTPQGKIGTTPISAVRAASAFRPLITSDAMRDGRIVFDATNDSNFLLSVQNPVGSPPHKILLSGEPVDPTCPKSGSGPGAPISFAPTEFHLDPGATQVVIASVAGCLTAGTRPVILKTVNGDEPGAWTETVISLSKYASTSMRQLSLLALVIFGSIISVLLNNIFPVNRTKAGLRNDLLRADEILRESASAGPALIDSLTAETTRLRLSLRRIHAYDSTKQAATQEAQRAVATLAAAATLTHKISLMRSKVDGAPLSIATHAAIRSKLRDAEESLLAGDSSAATDRLNEAQAKLSEATADLTQNALRAALTSDLPRLLRERGLLVDARGKDGQTAEPIAAVKDTVVAAEQELQQPESRHPRIKAIIEQLHRDNRDLQKLSPQELLDIERDFYVADIWTEYVEPKLNAFNEPSFATRRPALINLSDALLECLLRNPKSDHVQVLLDLMRSEVTPDEVAAALARGEARIECDPRPKYLESVSLAFVFTNPLFNDVPAVRRLLTYSWSISDDTAPPPNVDRIRHYFRQPKLGWRSLQKKPTATVESSVRAATMQAAETYSVTVTVGVPFTADKTYTLPARMVTPRRAAGVWWKVEPMELASFGVTTAIAVVTAFGAHYASSLPNVITWSDWLSSFMLGFGLDQLRDTVTTSTVVTPVGPAVQPATSPAAPAALAGVVQPAR
jgi:hypothetical protein